MSSLNLSALEDAALGDPDLNDKDGTRFLTSVAKWPFDIWMMEGFNPPKTWVDHLLRR